MTHYGVANLLHIFTIYVVPRKYFASELIENLEEIFPR